MNKNVRRNVVQFRLSDAEKAAFDEVKQAINAKNNADAIRTMIADERLVNITAQQVSKNNHSMAQLLEQTWSDLGRSSLSRAVLGLQSDEGLNALKQVQDTYDNIQAQLEGLLWSATNLTNNVNQISHAANLAMQDDPTNADTWNWIIEAIQGILPLISQLQDAINNIKDETKEAGS